MPPNASTANSQGSPSRENRAFGLVRVVDVFSRALDTKGSATELSGTKAVASPVRNPYRPKVGPWMLWRCDLPRARVRLDLLSDRKSVLGATIFPSFRRCARARA